MISEQGRWTDDIRYFKQGAWRPKLIAGDHQGSEETCRSSLTAPLSSPTEWSVNEHGERNPGSVFLGLFTMG